MFLKKNAMLSMMKKLNRTASLCQRKCVHLYTLRSVVYSSRVTVHMYNDLSVRMNISPSASLTLVDMETDGRGKLNQVAREEATVEQVAIKFPTEFVAV